MNVSAWVWLISLAVVAALFVFDFFSHVRTPHAPTMRESAVWSSLYVLIAVLFGIGVWWFSGGTYAGEFFAGYITEKSLSVDNLFVFAIIFARFQVPARYQQKVLLLGIVMALVLRGIFIGLGAAAINAFSWVFYLFGLFLVLTAAKLIHEALRPGDEAGGPAKIMALVGKVVPSTTEYDGTRLVTKISGRRFATPLLVALVVIGFADVLFALDSIPAIYGLTQEPYLVFMANALSLMGLLQLYFLLGGLLDRLVYLSYGLAVILGFIGVKLILHALAENTLPFLASGEPIAVPEVSTGVSLGVIGGVLAVTVVASLIRSRTRGARS